MRKIKLIKLVSLFLAVTGIVSNLQAEDYYSNDFEAPRASAYVGMSLLEGAVSVAANPLKAGINTSDSALQIVRTTTDDLGQTWAGFIEDLTTAGLSYTFDASKPYLHIRVLKPMISEVKAKLEGDGGALEIASIAVQTKTNEWEDMVFDFSAYSGGFAKIIVMPFWVDALEGGDNDTIYLDDLYFSSSNTPDTDITTLTSKNSISPLKIMPNPCTNYIQIEGCDETDAKVNICSLNGQTLQTANSTVDKIDISNLSNGIYIVSVETAGYRYTAQFIKK